MSDGTLPRNRRPRTLIVGGPAGAGKSTLAAAIADKLGIPFYEGDLFHSASNLEKIRRGQGLSTADRWPWVAVMGDAIRRDDPPLCVLACSALDPMIRKRMVDAFPGEVLFIHLDVPQAELRRRLTQREGHVAGPDLLPSQLGSLDRGDDVHVLNGTRSLHHLVGATLDFLSVNGWKVG